MPWLDDLQTLMEDAGVAVLGTDLFLTTAQRVPILASGEPTVQIVETSGSSPERTQNYVFRPAYTRPAAQITVRGRNVDAVRAKAREAYNAVVGIRNSWIINTAMTSSGWYREIVPLQEPFDVGKDDRDQARYGFNVIAVRRGKGD